MRGKQLLLLGAISYGAYKYGHLVGSIKMAYAMVKSDEVELKADKTEESEGSKTEE